MGSACTTGTAAVRSFAITASVVVLAAGCGRLGFSSSERETADAAPGDGAHDAAAASHDEDGDGIPDVDDPCPFLPGIDADSDLDGIGDMCDPHPSTPDDRLSVFATLRPGDVAFDDITGWTQETDGIRFDGMTGPLTLTHAFGRARIELG